MLNFSKIIFTEDFIYSSSAMDFNVSEIYIDKSSIGKNENEKLNYNFLAVGRKNEEAKKIIKDLANQNYYLTSHSNGVSVFSKLDNSELFLSHFKDKNVRVWNNIFYTLALPKIKSESNRLIVIFSSISDLPFNASISRRMFFKNNPNIADKIPENSYILRIADVGAVMGSAYLNTKANLSLETNVQSLITKIKLDNSIDDINTIFYGEGKGATGALYHGINLDIKTLAIDPIVSDEYYLYKYDDMHFVQDIVALYKQEAFENLLAEFKDKDLSHIKIITSANSEQFSYINNILFSKGINFHRFVINNPKIKTSKDIISHIKNIEIMMLNNLFYNISITSNINTTY